MKSTVYFLLAAGILTLAASLVGISDSPPGIALLYGAGLMSVLAVVHRWKQPKRFGILFLGSVAAFFIMVIVHNFAEVGADRISHLPALAVVLSGLSVVGFVIAVIVCPMAGVVGALGWVATAGRQIRNGT
ncbi:MAG: hypothetical protein HKO65_03800 [Gemmatimonadetes bacterium]|nr:hypothetical protein [Gemmatimonadota bacterium]NNM04203.1 hypothetical protein [Gemmatimonadota bacterium]